MKTSLFTCSIFRTVKNECMRSNPHIDAKKNSFFLRSQPCPIKRCSSSCNAIETFVTGSFYTMIPFSKPKRYERTHITPFVILRHISLRSLLKIFLFAFHESQISATLVVSRKAVYKSHRVKVMHTLSLTYYPGAQQNLPSLVFLCFPFWCRCSALV